jgi:hypothetical protein
MSEVPYYRKSWSKFCRKRSAISISYVTLEAHSSPNDALRFYLYVYYM